MVRGLEGFQVAKAKVAAFVVICAPSRLSETIPGGIEPMVEPRPMVTKSVPMRALETAFTLVETFSVELAGVTVRVPARIAIEVSESPE